MPLFGLISTRSQVPDWLERARERLEISWLGLGGRDMMTWAFDVADLEALMERHPDGIPEAALDHWADPVAQMLLPWAMVHVTLAAPVVGTLHGDGLCTIAAAPDGPSATRNALGDGAGWLPEAPPGPALARSLGSPGGSAALVARVGTVVWGGTADEVLTRADALEETAAAWLRQRGAEIPGGGGSAAGVDDGPRAAGLDRDLELALAALRGGLCGTAPGVLHVDRALVTLARRPDHERVVATAGALEPHGPWSVHPALATNLPEKALANAVLDPRIGLVTVDRDGPSAQALGTVAAHVHRVALALLEAFAGTTPLEAFHPGSGLVSRPRPRRPIGPAQGRVYVVTGAASGIGRDVARHLASLGAQLALADLSADGLEHVAAELDGPQGRPLIEAGDLTAEEVPDRVVSAAMARFGGIDGAVLNVGVALPGEIDKLSVADWRRSLDVNTTSHFLLVRRLLPVLKAQGLGGSLVFIGSKNMFSPGAGFGAYSASKAALAQLARLVAIEAGPFGVRSNIVNPDNVFEGSALWSPELRAQRAAVYGVRPEDLEAYYTQRNLLKVPISGMDVARAVAFLLSDDAARTTACVLTVDGGVPGVFPR